MKRILAISLMLVYLTVSAGVLVSYHFCGGKLAEVAFFKGSKNCCADANSPGSCCQNSSLILKVSDDSSNDIAFPNVPASKFTSIIQRIFTATEGTSSAKIANEMFDAYEIKHLDKQPIYLTNRVFII